MNTVTFLYEGKIYTKPIIDTCAHTGYPMVNVGGYDCIAVSPANIVNTEADMERQERERFRQYDETARAFGESVLAAAIDVVNCTERRWVCGVCCSPNICRFPSCCDNCGNVR